MTRDVRLDTTLTGFCLWFTGLPGSGKTTLSSLVGRHLGAQGLTVAAFDGDAVRRGLSRDLAFSAKDRLENTRRLGRIAHQLTRLGAHALIASIAPYRAARAQNRDLLGNYIEIYCRCPLETLIARDPKGLYRRALAGEISDFTGITAPYEPPLAPEIEVDTGLMTVDACLARILGRLDELGVSAPPRAVLAQRPGLNGAA